MQPSVRTTAASVERVAHQDPDAAPAADPVRERLHLERPVLERVGANERRGAVRGEVVRPAVEPHERHAGSRGEVADGVGRRGVDRDDDQRVDPCVEQPLDLLELRVRLAGRVDGVELDRAQLRGAGLGPFHDRREKGVQVRPREADADCEIGARAEVRRGRDARRGGRRQRAGLTRCDEHEASEQGRCRSGEAGHDLILGQMGSGRVVIRRA